MNACLCGCGRIVTKEGNKYIRGHNWVDHHHLESSKKAIGEGNKGKGGRRMTQETIEQIRIANRQKMLNGRSVYLNSIPRSSERMGKRAEKMRLRMLGNSNPAKNPEVGRLISERKKGISYFSGDKHPLWKGGVSFEPYTVDFTNELKRKIRERDNYICQLCFKFGKHVHHIDEGKKNCDPTNLITLCNKDNLMLSNKDKGIWAIFYRPYFETIAKGICV
jgi:hypothetical protein